MLHKNSLIESTLKFDYVECAFVVGLLWVGVSILGLPLKRTPHIYFEIPRGKLVPNNASGRFPRHGPAPRTIVPRGWLASIVKPG